MEKQLVASLYRLPDDGNDEWYKLEQYRLEVYEGYTLLEAFRLILGAVLEGITELVALEKQVKEERDARKSGKAQGE